MPITYVVTESAISELNEFEASISTAYLTCFLRSIDYSIPAKQMQL